MSTRKYNLDNAKVINHCLNVIIGFYQIINQKRNKYIQMHEYAVLRLIS